jgi:hypothetical protein
MSLHVDIIKTDPLSSGERRLAQAVFDGETVSITATNDSAYWRATLAAATAIDPETEPQRFFESLPDALDGTYVYATTPHEDAECPIEHPEAATA